MHCSAFFFFVSIVSSALSSHKALVYIFGRAIWSQRACGLWEHSLRQEHKHCDVPIPRASLSQWEFCYGIIQHACLQYMHTKSLFISKLFSFDCTAAVYYVRVFCYVMGVFSDQFSDQWQNCSATVSWPLSSFCLHLITHSPVCSPTINCPLIWIILISILIDMWLNYLSYCQKKNPARRTKPACVSRSLIVIWFRLSLHCLHPAAPSPFVATGDINI